MRLWSLHPRHLDRAGLIACWREALLAQAVIDDPGRGYANHPQLIRFRREPDPARAVGDFLAALAEEADARGYRFDRGKIRPSGTGRAIPVTDEQLEWEHRHLLAKLDRRSPESAERLRRVADPDPHPLFAVVPGPVEDWERGAATTDDTTRSRR